MTKRHTLIYWKIRYIDRYTETYEYSYLSIALGRENVYRGIHVDNIREKSQCSQEVIAEPFQGS